MSNDIALALAVAVASTPTWVWVLRLAPRRHARTRARADRALFRLARAGCPNPAQCPTCATLTDRVDALHDRLAIAEGWVEETEATPNRTEGTTQ